MKPADVSRLSDLLDEARTIVNRSKAETDAAEGMRGSLDAVPTASICIDPGHGGRDPGAVAADGTTEAEVVLQVGKALRDVLKARRHRVVMTRDDDTYPSLSARAELANREGVDCFISIHANAASSSMANGAWVIHDDKTTKETGVALATEIFRAMVKIPGIGDADAAEEVYADATPWVGGRQLAVVSRTRMPAALVELGFMTNEDDLDDLKRPETRNRLAMAIADGIEAWLRGK